MGETGRSRDVISIKPIESQIEGFMVDSPRRLTINGVRAAAILFSAFRGLI